MRAKLPGVPAHVIATAALVLAVAALMVALSADAGSGGSKVPGKRGVKSSDIALGAVKGPQLGKVFPRQDSVDVPAGATVDLHADCLKGEQLIGNGYDWNSGNSEDLQVLNIRPIPPFHVQFRVYNGSGVFRIFTGIATCLKRK